MPELTQPLIELPSVEGKEGAIAPSGQIVLLPRALVSDKGSFCQDFVRISNLALPMGLSYTLSFAIAGLPALINHLNGNSEERTAATTSIQTMMNSVLFIAQSPTFAMSLMVSNKIGDLKDSERRGASEEELTRKRNHIAAINHAGLLMSAIIIPFAILPFVFS